jgi:hypothetical protein
MVTVRVSGDEQRRVRHTHTPTRVYLSNIELGGWDSRHHVRGHHGRFPRLRRTMDFISRHGREKGGGPSITDKPCVATNRNLQAVVKVRRDGRTGMAEGHRVIDYLGDVASDVAA